MRSSSVLPIVRPSLPQYGRALPDTSFVTGIQGAKDMITISRKVAYALLILAGAAILWYSAIPQGIWLARNVYVFEQAKKAVLAAQPKPTPAPQPPPAEVPK
jgi:hypothetical protein